MNDRSTLTRPAKPVVSLPVRSRITESDCEWTVAAVNTMAEVGA